MTVLISHNAAGGSMLEGTSRGDGAAAIIKPLGWRWSRHLNAWYLRGTRDHQPNTDLLNRTAATLQRAGLNVELDIDDATRPLAEVEHDRQERANARADHLERRAATLEACSDTLEETARERASHIPFGQPILIGHHSEARDRRARARIAQTMERAADTMQQATADRARAAATRAHAAHRTAPTTVGNRLERLEAERRRLDRLRTTASTAARERLEVQIEDLDRQISHWQHTRDEQIAAGIALELGPSEVSTGDLVRIGGHWHRVERANPKSVTVRTEFGTQRAPYHRITAHRRASEQ